MNGQSVLPDNRQLQVIDEEGNVLGVESRAVIHQQGLLHREVHVWFYTKQGQIIFQHRSKDKATCPDLLDATVGGHVEMGLDFEDTALQEVAEETGLLLTIDDLTFLQMIRSNAFDSVTGMTNNAVRAVYAYYYNGRIEDLLVEEDRAIGFEALDFDTFFSLNDVEKQRFIPSLFDAETLAILHRISNLA